MIMSNALLVVIDAWTKNSAYQSEGRAPSFLQFQGPGKILPPKKSWFLNLNYPITPLGDATESEEPLVLTYVYVSTEN